MLLLAATRGSSPKIVLQTKPYLGCLWKTSKATESLLSRELHKSSHLTTSQLKAKNVSTCCIQHCLQDLKLPVHHGVCKSILMDCVKRAQLDFNKKFIHWTADKWRKVMQSDELTFQCVILDCFCHSKIAIFSQQTWPCRHSSHYLTLRICYDLGCFIGLSGHVGLHFPSQNSSEFWQLHSSSWRSPPVFMRLMAALSLCMVALL